MKTLEQTLGIEEEEEDDEDEDEEKALERVVVAAMAIWQLGKEEDSLKPSNRRSTDPRILFIMGAASQVNYQEFKI